MSPLRLFSDFLRYYSIINGGVYTINVADFINTVADYTITAVD